MKPEIRTLVDISGTPAAMQGRADMMLERARWASSVFRRYDRPSTMRIVEAVAQTAHENAGKYAEWAVKETGFGVAAHKQIKNELTAKPLVDFYRDADFVNLRIDARRRIIEMPIPAGVIFALAPSTNPIATMNFKVLLALMTRNAIVFSPHPAARECCIDAAQKLMDSARQAGAPEAVIQILEEPSIPMVEAFMHSPKTNVILATGGTAMVRAAYSSSNPAIGVGPGNAPVFVDPSADVKAAAKKIVDSKSFDNSILCTNESVLITLPEVEKPLVQAMKSAGAYLCTEDETARLRRFLFHERGFNVEAIGRDASWIAQECQIKVPESTRILLAPIEQIGVEEKLSREKLCPVLALHVAKNQEQAMSQARAVLMLSGAGHSAAIHASDEKTVMRFANAVPAYRVVVNAPCSQGAAGFSTNLAPSFTIGTGYYGKSSVGENIGPQHLVHWSRIAFCNDPKEAFGNFDDIHQGFEGPLPEAPSDGVPGSPKGNRKRQILTNTNSIDGAAREEIRRLIVEELRDLLKK
jgi:acyl-CoA reductase-like NAD-dependent aldehyde dehydrogenase